MTAENINAQGEDAVTARNLPLTIHAQYVKDLSWENPGAPGSLKPDAGKPAMNMSINVGLVEVQDDKIPGLYEVSLRVRTQAKRDEKTAFIVEVEYAAAVTVGSEVPPETMHPLLLIEVPRLLFPYVRYLISQLSQHGGYPALNIAPVDFQALYIQKFSAEMDIEAVEKKAAGK